jgi:hypothetical protein
MSANSTALMAVRSLGQAQRPARHRPGDVGVASGDGFALTSVSWAAGEEMGFEQWVVNGRRLGAVGRSVGWWIGDWLHYGNARYGEKYAQAAKITGYDTQTLMNMVYVAGSIHPSLRRERLSWSHHAEVAAMDPEDQRHWLDRAEESRLSVRDLRLLVRKSRGREKPDAVTRKAAVDHEVICSECGRAFQPAAEEAAQSIVGLVEACATDL